MQASAYLTPIEQAATLQPIEHAVGIPSRFYTNADSAQLERDTLLSNAWSCIGFASDIQPSEAVPVYFMGLPLLIVASPQADIKVFHNVCRHRGHLLVSERGRQTGALRCPYHSWTYQFDGQLRGTPHIGGHGVHECASFDKRSKGLLSVRCAIWMDMIFINLSGEAEDFASFIAPLEARFSRFVGTPQGLQTYQAWHDPEPLRMRLACNWKLAVENYCESYHLPWVHPELNSYSKIEDHYNIEADDWGAGQGSTRFEFSERAGIDLPRHPQWPEQQRHTAEYLALFPNVLVGIQNDHFFAMLLMPSAPDCTDETVKLYFVGESANDPAHKLARERIKAGWQGVFAEDIDVCEGMQKGRACQAYDGGAFSPALDGPTLHFHQWVARRLPLAPAHNEEKHTALKPPHRATDEMAAALMA